MPLYDFHCRACGIEFEALVRTGGAAPECPECHANDLERLLSIFAVSSEGTRQAAIKDSKKRQLRTRRDEVAAEEAYRKEHEGH
jgi:putative FmdB family regulatory protein